MNNSDFNKVIKDQIEKCMNTLGVKAQEYAEDNDRLHNFKNAAGMMNSNPKEALAGMMAKHTISIYDMCRSGEKYSLAQWEEKIGDHINYLLLLKAIIVEELYYEYEKLKGEKMAENKYKIVYFNTYCYKCKHCLTKETSDPCNECLNNPINENSRRPIHFEEENMVTKGD